MEKFKKVLGFLLFLAALFIVVFRVLPMLSLELMAAGKDGIKFVSEDWFVKIMEKVVVKGWDLTIITILGLSRMLAVKNGAAIFFTVIVWIALAAVTVLALQYPDKVVDLLK